MRTSTHMMSSADSVAYLSVFMVAYKYSTVNTAVNSSKNVAKAFAEFPARVTIDIIPANTHMNVRVTLVASLAIMSRDTRDFVR